MFNYQNLTKHRTKIMKIKRLGVENANININLYIDDEIKDLMDIAKDVLTLRVARSKYVPTKAYVLKKALKSVIKEHDNK